MAHFAEIDENNRVVRVAIVSNGEFTGTTFEDFEQSGLRFLDRCNIEGRWLLTSTSARFRHKFAGMGMIYLEDHDAFINPQPFPSWVLDLSDPEDWVAPIPMPTEEGYWYEWDEEGQTWIPHEI
jgi:hypothetical protein